MSLFGCLVAYHGFLGWFSLPCDITKDEKEVEFQVEHSRSAAWLLDGLFLVFLASWRGRLLLFFPFSQLLFSS